MAVMPDDAFVRHVQRLIGATEDGIAGNDTQEKLRKALGLAGFMPSPSPITAGQPLDERSEKKLVGVHPDLVKVVRLAALTAPLPFVVLEGPRTVQRQKQLVASGDSQTMRSRHIPGADGYAKAVDIAPLGPDGQVSWSWPLYHRLAPAMWQAGEELGVQLEWGGAWKSFKDGPHWQLPWGVYP